MIIEDRNKGPKQNQRNNNKQTTQDYQAALLNNNYSKSNNTKDLSKTPYGAVIVQLTFGW